MLSEWAGKLNESRGILIISPRARFLSFAWASANVLNFNERNQLLCCELRVIVDRDMHFRDCVASIEKHAT